MLDIDDAEPPVPQPGEVIEVQAFRIGPAMTDDVAHPEDEVARDLP